MTCEVKLGYVKPVTGAVVGRQSPEVSLYSDKTFFKLLQFCLGGHLFVLMSGWYVVACKKKMSGKPVCL